MPSKMAGNRGSTTPPPESGSGTQTTRIQRNLAEKNRRDKLNGFINELATIVPMVAMASKRLDKTSILRLSAAHLRIYHSSLSGRCKKSRGSFRWRPNFLSSEQIREILDAVDGFLLVTTTNGKIMYISQSVEKFLGHQHIEMMGLSLFLFIHPSDLDMVQAQLQALSLAVGSKNGSTNSSSARCSFYCRMRERSQPRSEVLTYQFVHVVGHMTCSSSDDDSSSDEEESAPRASQNNLLLKAFVRVVHSNPYNELSLTAAIEDEYVTRHSLDGTIIFADHRLSTITGHLPHEVYGMSAYEYIAQEDIPIALFAHKLMFSQDSGTGLIVYRLRTRNQGFVYLKSTGYLQFERSSSQVDHFVCVNRQLSDDDGEKELKNFIDRFTPHITGSSPSSLYESIRAVQASGLAVATPPAVSLKSDIIVTFSGDTSAVTKLREKNSHVKSEPSDQVVSSRKPEEYKSSDDGIVHSKNNQMYIGCYNSKRILEKMSLESENVGQVFPTPSPLTESSLSANSPQSDETSVASPNEGGQWSVDSMYHSPDTCSSPNMPTSPLSPGKDHDMMDSSLADASVKSARTSPVISMRSVETPDEASEASHPHILSPPSSDPVLMSDDATDFYVSHLATPPLLPINEHLEPLADQNDEACKTNC